MLSVLPAESQLLYARTSVNCRHALWTIARCQYHLQLYQEARDLVLGVPWAVEDRRRVEARSKLTALSVRSVRRQSKRKPTNQSRGIRTLFVQDPLLPVVLESKATVTITKHT